MTNSISFWLIVAVIVLIIIWWQLRRNGANTPGGVATPGDIEKSKSLPPDSSGTNAHPPRSIHNHWKRGTPTFRASSLFARRLRRTTT